VIPDHNQSGVLPPFLPGLTPAIEGATSPYRVSLLNLAKRFSINEERIKILNGFIAYRNALRAVGFNHGFQWIDGSFVEDAEYILGRPPADIDLITFATRPEKYSDQENWRNFLRSRPDLFDPKESKKQYLCDAYFVDLQTNPLFLVNQTKYWFGLFSHQRETFQWKGMLEISIAEDDAEVLAFIAQGDAHVS